MSRYKCDHSPGGPNKRLTLICETCLRAWIARHNRMLEFIKDRVLLDVPTDVIESMTVSAFSEKANIALAAKEILKEIGELK